MSDNEFVINPDNVRHQRSHANGYPNDYRSPDKNENNNFFDDATESSLNDIGASVKSEAESSSKEDSANPRNRDIKHTHQNERKRRRTDKEKQQSDDADEETPAIVNFLLSRRVGIWLGMVLLILSVAIFITLLSFLKNGASDQALILNMSTDELRHSGLSLDSEVGIFGARFGQYLFADSFGLGAFVLAIYLAIVGFNLLFNRPFNFWGLTFRSILLTVSISIVLGLITYPLASSTFWGGIHGHYANRWLLEMTGIPGALAVSAILICTIIAVYFNELRNAYIKWRNKIEERRAEHNARLEEKRKHHISSPETDKPSEKTDETKDDTSVSKAASEDNDIIEVTLQEDSKDNTPSDIDDQAKTSTIGGFDIDAPSEESLSTDTPRKHDSNKPVASDDVDAGFEIDVPITEMGKKTGSVAERLVAEQGEYDPRADLSRFKFPALDMLADHPVKITADIEEQQANKDRIIKTLGNYGITISTIKATVGPTVTLYEIVPTEGTRIAQIKRLEDDIALSLAAKGIRIIAPMPGKGTVGIEVPNGEPQTVAMRTILASKKFRESKGALPIAIGATISNDIFVTDLAAMPHALVAGATGQGKSVGLNVLITSLLYRKHPSELKFVLIDPKMVEFSVYERLKKHYLATLPGEEDAVVTDPGKVLTVLNSLCTEMDNRYNLLRLAAVNKIEDYNRKFCQRRLNIEKGHRYLPYIVVIIDEFADLIMTGGKEIEMPVMRITQKARAVGIHMIIATQRPSTNVLTGIIKANCPSRIAFRTLQNVDSRTILDRTGAERLIGRGDMLYSQGGDMERMQCAFVTSDEIEAICNFIEQQPGYATPYELPEPATDGTGMPLGSGTLPAGGLDRDPLFADAARFIVMSSTASTSSLQRRFEIGYNRAGKLMDQMEASGIVGPASGAKPRAVLIDPATLEQILSNR
ncbi:MAG: DNA translocase FtsK [Muribaculaceae bacterium]|nr:DNA translocase FtsK [Muribaculaceae bacterium]